MVSHKFETGGGQSSKISLLSGRSFRSQQYSIKVLTPDGAMLGDDDDVSSWRGQSDVTYGGLPLDTEDDNAKKFITKRDFASNLINSRAMSLVALPVAYSKTGTFLGPFTLLLALFLSIGGGLLTIKLQRGLSNAREIWSNRLLTISVCEDAVRRERISGFWGSVLVMFITGLDYGHFMAKTVVMFILAGKAGADLVDILNPTAAEFFTLAIPWRLFFFLPICLISLGSSIDFIAKISKFGVGATFLLFLLPLCMSIQEFFQTDRDQGYSIKIGKVSSQISTASVAASRLESDFGFFSFFGALSICVSALSFNPYLPAQTSSLKNMVDANTTLIRTSSLLCLTMISIGSSVYYYWGNGSWQNLVDVVVMLKQRHSWFWTVGVFMVGALLTKVVCAVPVYMFTVFRDLEKYFQLEKKFPIRTVSRIVILFSLVLVAVIFPHFKPVVSFVTSFFVVFPQAILPVLLHMLMSEKSIIEEIFENRLIAAYSLCALVLGCGAMLGGITSAFFDLHKAMEKNPDPFADLKQVWSAMIR